MTSIQEVRRATGPASRLVGLAALPDWLRHAARRTPISAWTASDHDRVWPGPFAVAWAVLERDLRRVEERVDPVGIASLVATGR